MYSSDQRTWYVFNSIGVNYVHAGTCSTNRMSHTHLQTAPGSCLDGSACDVVSGTAWVGYWWPCRLPEVSAWRQTSIEFQGLCDMLAKESLSATTVCGTAWAIAGDNPLATGDIFGFSLRHKHKHKNYGSEHVHNTSLSSITTAIPISFPEVAFP